MTLIDFVTKHLTVILLFWLVFSAAVGSMPKLPDNASWKARWLYGFAHLLAMNLRFGLNFFKVPLPPESGKEEPKA